MGWNKAAFEFDNAGAAAPSGNLGPFSLPTTIKVLAARCNYTEIGQFVSVSTSTVLEQPTMTGLQVVFQGDTPFDLPSGAGLVNFLDTKPLQDDTFPYVWSPDSAVAAAGGFSYRQLRWNGQKYFGSALDFYFTWGSTYVSLNQEYSGHLEVIYTT